MSIFSILGGWSRFAKDQRIAELTIDNHLLRERVAYLLEEQAADKRLIAALHEDIAKLHAKIANAEMEGPKRTLEKQNDAQAARAMSRQTKQAFQVYQGAVKVLLDQLDTVGKKNVITTEDVRKLRQLREDLSFQLGRTI